MHTRSVVVLIGLVLLGCTPGESDDGGAAPADSLTRAQRDSLIRESDLPGAGAVGRAREASRAAEERAARMDSIQP